MSNTEITASGARANPSRTYKILSPAAWELIRAGYLGGETARALAERYGTTEHAIRRRAWKEKWTKRDYAEALQARGLEPPPRAQPRNIAERFAAMVRPPANASPELRVSAAELERQALQRLSEALQNGRATDAKALAALAEQLGRRAAFERAVADTSDGGEAMRAEIVEMVFANAAYVASTMVHAPALTPSVFSALAAAWRRKHLAEDEWDAAAAAARMAEAEADYLSGAWMAGTPDYVREKLEVAWLKVRRALDAK